MATRTDVEVIIDGKNIVLSGYESEEYIQKVASFINQKNIEYGKNESFRKQTRDMQNILIQLDIADEYFKAKKKLSMSEVEQGDKDKETYELKHEIVALQMKIEKLELENKGLRLQILSKEAEQMKREATESLNKK